MTSTNRKRMVTPWCQISQKKKKKTSTSAMLQPQCCFHVHAAGQGKHSLECWQIDVPLPPAFSRQWTIYFCGGSQVTSCRVFVFFLCVVFILFLILQNMGCILYSLTDIRPYCFTKLQSLKLTRSIQRNCQLVKHFVTFSIKQRLTIKFEKCNATLVI